MSKWQPIETAPRNRRILIHSMSPATGHHSVHLVWWRSPYEGGEHLGFWEQYLWGSESHPVVPQFTHHWMDLPEPPE